MQLSSNVDSMLAPPVSSWSGAFGQLCFALRHRSPYFRKTTGAHHQVPVEKAKQRKATQFQASLTNPIKASSYTRPHVSEASGLELSYDSKFHKETAAQL